MKVQKAEITKVIDKLKGIVQKNDRLPALEGILVKEGYLIASNTETTIQAKMEASEGESFIIPMKAIDLIKSLPDGEIEITADRKNAVTIKAKSINNKYASIPAKSFAFDRFDLQEKNAITLPAKQLMESIGHVVFAAADKDVKQSMNGILFESNGNELNLVGLNGRIVAWDKIDMAEEVKVEMIVPKSAAKKILSLALTGDIEISYNTSSAVFKTEDMAIMTRLINGKYFAYTRIFKNSGCSCTATDKRQLTDAVARASMCLDDRKPVAWGFKTDELVITVNESKVTYEESVPLQLENDNDVRIGFDPKLILEALKAFTCENISINFSTVNAPMIMEAEDSDMKVAVMPVRLEGQG